MAEEWWVRVRSGGRDSYAAGKFLELPEVGILDLLFHKSIEKLYVREAFDPLYCDIVDTLAAEDCTLCHLNGNSGVGKSAFLWYFIIRTGIERPESTIIYEAEVSIWEFRGQSLKLVDKKDYPLYHFQSYDLDYHLIDQKITSGRPLGVRALVAASPEESNMKTARKLRTTCTRYLPVWGKGEYDALVASWKARAESLPRLPGGGTSVQADRIHKRVAAANLAYEWFGGVPRFLWDREVETLTEEKFSSDVMRCLGNTKLKNVAAVLQNSTVSWRLFHFSLKPGSFTDFCYTFCSDKVANLYGQHLCTTDVDKLRRFLDASEPFKEYATLRGYVFKQYSIGQALKYKLMALPMVDSTYCGECHEKNERKNNQRIQCATCLSWFHAKCVRVKVVTMVGTFQCKSCEGASKVEPVSPGSLLLRYYEGELEDELLAAGPDAAKYLWRPLKKNNAVFDFVMLPRTLGQATVSLEHKPPVQHLVKAMQALRQWRQEYDPSYSENDDIILLFFIPPDIFPRFRFQPYRVSGKVSQKAVEGVVQCKVAVPVQGSPYVSQLQPRRTAGVASVDPETWEETLGCVQATEEEDGPEMLLTREKTELAKRKLVYEGDAWDELEDVCKLGSTKGSRSRLQALCKIFKVPANTSNEQMLKDLKDKRVKLEAMEEEEAMEVD